MKNSFYQFADEYIHLAIAGKTISVPYSISKEGEKRAIGGLSSAGVTGRFVNYGGKGTPAQIKKIVITSAKKEHFDLQKATSKEIADFMIQKGIGVDCSGFVYYILDQYLQKEKQRSLDSLVLRYSGILGRMERFLLQKNRVRRSSAATLTSGLNTIKIEKVKDMLPGDMLRVTHKDWKGKHIIILVNINKKYITYATASQYTKMQGAHFGKIKIKDENKGLEYQEWQEKTRKGKNYGKDVFDPKKGDSARRLKYLW